MDWTLVQQLFEIVSNASRYPQLDPLYKAAMAQLQAISDGVLNGKISAIPTSPEIAFTAAPVVATPTRAQPAPVSPPTPGV